MKQTKFNKFVFDSPSFASRLFSPMCAFLRSGGLIFLLAFFAAAQDLPDKIRGYKVYDGKVAVGAASEKNAVKSKIDAQVKVGEPEIVEVSLSGVTFEISAEIFNSEQSGTVDFLTFRDFRVNDLAVEIEDYTESFEFKKNQIVRLPKPARISLSAPQALRGAMRESKNSLPEWTVKGRVFVFGKFKKFGLSFKRVIPVDVNIKIKNPLKETSADSSE